MPPPDRLSFVARAPRGPFGRLVKALFWVIAIGPPLLMLGTCAGLTRFVTSEDQEVAMGALMFGAEALGILWAVWVVGTPVLGLLALLTRGRRMVIEAPPPRA